MKGFKLYLSVMVGLFLIIFSDCGGILSNSMAGNWAFSLPDQRPVWLSIKEDTTARLLWSAGSPKSVTIRKFEHNYIVLQGEFGWRPFSQSDWYHIEKPMFCRMGTHGDLFLTVAHQLKGKEDIFTLSGKRMPPLPAKPDLSKIILGEPVDLLANGMQGWVQVNPQQKNGWRFEDGILINETPKKDFSAYGQYANLKTVSEFMDFELLIDWNVPVGGNSGIYLRGTYEVQVVDRESPMQGIQGPGAIFGRIEPTMNNANPGGEWNTYRCLLVDRHITVELNGKVVIDNKPLEGCTGGGINADDTKPGPLFLQGDHTSVKYRNIILRKVTGRK